MLSVPSRRLLLSGGRTAFSPLSLAPVLWLKSDAGLTLSTSGYAGTGTVTQVGTAITGSGTAFLSEVVVGDVLSGTLISGTVTVITNNTNLTVDASNTGAGAAYTITPTAGTSDRVTTWTDQSGNGKDAVQSSVASNPPKIPNTQNGLAAVRGNGVNSKLDLPSISLGTTHTVFYVLKALTGATGVVTGFSTSGYLTYTDGSNWYYSNGGSVNVALAFGTTTKILAVRRNGTTVQFFLNGTQTGVDKTLGSNNATTATTLFCYSNGTQGLKTNIMEHVIINTSISDANLANMFSYLNTRWAVY